jgi:hypothetical protein
MKGHLLVYQSKLAAAIKANGKVLRESGNTVILPFGSEYSVFLKNMNSVRVLATVEIDGQDATGSKMIIEPNSSLELERFLRNGNMERGNRFKFIERIKAIEEHRGIRAEDGLVRVEFWTERVTRYIPRVVYHDVPATNWLQPWYMPSYTPSFGSVTCTANGTVASATNGNYNTASGQYLNSMTRCAGLGKSRGFTGLTGQSMNCATMDSAFDTMERSVPVNDAGITVPGSESNQRFVQGSWFQTETQSEVIVLHLRGNVGGQEVMQPLTVDRRLTCFSCGKATLSSFKFCPRCGTVLTLA